MSDASSGCLELSVVVPCCNVARWLPQCLDDVFAALPASAEVIAVDDGSTDGTFSILCARTDPRLVVLTQSNAGVSAARNRALDVARGRIVFFVDPDDGVEPDFFKSMVEAIDRTGADCCVCGYAERNDGSTSLRPVPLKGDYSFDSNAEIVARYLPRIFGYSLADVRAWYAGKPLFADREMAFACRMAYRRDLIEERRIRFDETVSLCEDAMFNAECLLAAGRMTCVDRPLYRVTYRPSGATSAVPRDGVRYCRNKLRLLRRREALDRRAGGTLAALYAGSSVFSALEIVRCLLCGRVSPAEGMRILRDYLATPSVRVAVRGFPLSLRHPVLFAAVLGLRLALAFVPARKEVAP